MSKGPCGKRISGVQSGARGRSWKLGHQQHQGPENQSSQHKLIEPRESSPEFSEECQKPQPPLLLKKVSQYASNLYCNTLSICIAVLPVPPRSEERKIFCQDSSHLYRSNASHLYCTMPPHVYRSAFWENLGGYVLSVSKTLRFRKRGNAAI